MTQFKWAAVTTALLLGACQGNTDDAAADAGENTEDAVAAIPVEVGSVSRGDIYSTYSGTAPIEAYAEARVVAKVGGEIVELLVEEGDVVREGQVLARLDGDRLRLEAQQSEARLQQLRRDFARNGDLRKRGLISEGDFDKIQYEMEALEASYELARLELGYTEIRAPIDGVIAERFAKTGNTIAVGDPVYQVVSLEPLVAYLHVPEREYRRIRGGMPASVAVDALGGTRLDARIARVSPVVDPQTGTFKITVEVSDPESRLKPGMFARIGIVSDMHANALQIPRSALVDDAGEPAVFVVSDDVAALRAVQTGYTANGNIEVTDGLADGEKIVVVGQTGLRDGTRVQVVNAAETPQDALAGTPALARDDS